MQSLTTGEKGAGPPFADSFAYGDRGGGAAYGDRGAGGARPVPGASGAYDPGRGTPVKIKSHNLKIK